MKYFLISLLFGYLFLGTSPAYARKHKNRGLPQTEVGLMNNVLGCLANKDTIGYFYLFPPFDSLWSFVMHNPDHSPETAASLDSLKEHPQSLLQFDPNYNHSIIGRFCKVLQKGEDSGIHWKEVAMERYELYKEGPTLSLAGYEKIAPERFKGYMFIRDLLGRRTFCVPIAEIQKIDGYFFGGQVINILEASSVDEYFFKEQEEQKYFDWLAKHPLSDSADIDSTKKSRLDSAMAAKNDSMQSDSANTLLDNTIVDDDKPQTRKEVIDRKYYEGKFDNEIPVKLYVRYMKDPVSNKLLAYDGLYKFGDQKDYIKLVITKNPDGKWEMEDELPLGSMELDLKNKVYTGSWLNNANQTGYDAVLTQTDIPEKTLEQLDKILERGLSGRADEDNTQDTENTENKKESPIKKKIRKWDDNSDY